MKREITTTAVVFFGVGFLAGYIYERHRKVAALENAALTEVTAPRTDAPPGAASGSSRAEGGTLSGLPEGHPPVDVDALVRALEEEAARNPRDPEPRLRLANLLYDQKQFQRSIEWYQRSLELDPSNVNARTDMGTAYFYTGRPREALREYRKALAVDPKHEPTLFNTIVVNLEGTRDLAAAQEAWDRLRQLNPSHAGLESMRQRLESARASGAGVRGSR